MVATPPAHRTVRLLSGSAQPLWFPEMRYSENQQSLQRFHIALDDEDLLLLQPLLQSFFERRQEPSCFSASDVSTR
jgi:hypothetical protein